MNIQSILTGRNLKLAEMRPQIVSGVDDVSVECCELCNRSSSSFPVVRSDETRVIRLN